MSRKRTVALAVVVMAALAAGGCNKPTETSCRQALENMRVLLGTDNPTGNASLQGDIRRCRGGSTRKAVACASAAKTLEDLRACDFMGSRKGIAGAGVVPPVVPVVPVAPAIGVDAAIDSSLAPVPVDAALPASGAGGSGAVGSGTAVPASTDPALPLPPTDRGH